MGQFAQPGSFKVLITDDNEINSELMVQICHAYGWSYSCADNGARCLDLLRGTDDEYSVVLLDIHMPGMSGIEVTEKIRDCTSDLPCNIRIIAVTADTSDENRRKCEDAGVDAFIGKPVDIQRLRDVVEAI